MSHNIKSCVGLEYKAEIYDKEEVLRYQKEIYNLTNLKQLKKNEIIKTFEKCTKQL